MLNPTVSVISIGDVIATLRDYRERKGMDDALVFASDLTGISIDKLWEMVEEEGDK